MHLSCPLVPKVLMSLHLIIWRLLYRAWACLLGVHVETRWGGYFDGQDHGQMQGVQCTNSPLILRRRNQWHIRRTRATWFLFLPGTGSRRIEKVPMMKVAHFLYSPVPHFIFSRHMSGWAHMRRFHSFASWILSSAHWQFFATGRSGFSLALVAVATGISPHRVMKTESRNKQWHRGAQLVLESACLGVRTTLPQSLIPFRDSHSVL